MLILTWLVLSVLVGIFASKRGRSGSGWFLIAAVLSPLIGFIALLILKDIASEERAIEERHFAAYRRNLERVEEEERREARENEMELKRQQMEGEKKRALSVLRESRKRLLCVDSAEETCLNDLLRLDNLYQITALFCERPVIS